VRLRLAVAGLLALAVLAVVVAVPFALPDRAPTDEGAAPANGIEGLVVFEDLPRNHVRGEVDYDHHPPAGGPHADAWLACGVYDRPVRLENVVHALEHGTVWASHAPDLAPADVARLAAVLPPESIVSPDPDLPGPLVLTVWEHQVTLAGLDDPRLRAFLEAFGDGHTAPEPFASCRGGVRRYDAPPPVAV